MKCPGCGRALRGRAPYRCPHCGQRLASTRRRPLSDAPTPPALARAERPSGWLLSMLVLCAAALALLALAWLAVGAVRLGLQEREQIETQALQEHYFRGLAHLERGELELAIAEFEWITRFDPHDRRAQGYLSEARERLANPPTPTPEPRQPLETLYWERLVAAREQGDWAETIRWANVLVGEYPAYEREQVEHVLAEALYQAGQQAMSEGRLEETIRFLDRILAIQPDNARAAKERELARLYLDGLNYWEADWSRAIERLTLLYALDPDYQDVRQRLYQAYAEDGDLLAESEQWCKASERYAQALAIVAANDMRTKLSAAQSRCQATPSLTRAP